MALINHRPRRSSVIFRLSSSCGKRVSCLRCNSFDNLPEKGSPSPRPSLPKTFAARPAGMSALVSVQQGESPSVCLRQRAMLVFIIASANHAPQPVNEPASNEASGSRHVFRWTDADPGSFPGYARLKKAVVTAVTAASGRLTRDSCKSRHGCALGSRPFCAMTS